MRQSDLKQNGLKSTTVVLIVIATVVLPLLTVIGAKATGLDIVLAFVGPLVAAITGFIAWIVVLLHIFTSAITRRHAQIALSFILGAAWLTYLIFNMHVAY